MQDVSFGSAIVQSLVIQDRLRVRRIRKVCGLPAGEDLVCRVRARSLHITDTYNSRIVLTEDDKSSGQKVISQARICFLITHMEVDEIIILIYRRDIDMSRTFCIQYCCTGCFSDRPCNGFACFDLAVTILINRGNADRRLIIDL